MNEEKTVPPMVLVEWEDAKVIEGGSWVENKIREYKPYIFKQVGYLVLSDEQGIHITAAWSDDLIAPPDQIPKAMIRSITFLESRQEQPKRRGKNAKTSG